MQNELVSVIIPVYNMENFIDATLNSVLASSYRPLEVVVVDDGSTDNTGAIVTEFAAKNPNIHYFRQENKGVAAARNYAVSLTKGEYILPVDADNMISKEFISKALAILLAKPEVKVVVPKAEFFGDKSGEWKLPLFSLKLLARKNMIDTCAMYRKTDWVRIGGYCEEIIAREDWEFWISMLKEGGEVEYIDEVGLFYRVRKDSKRIQDRKLKKHYIDVLNQRHASFFEKQLGGKLHYSRTWSEIFNKIERFFYPKR
ncbi:MAG TPA: glycosyltransferase family A protein [Paludibacter sp.]|nr:glycosyltransferase family A protein [Paludibacter sp.]